ncbi:acetolactate synthase [Tanacetum coccineum]
MAVITPSNPTIKPPSSTTAFHRSTTTLPRFNLPITTPKRHHDQPRRGSDVLVEALEREGITDVFAYPGGAYVGSLCSMDLNL